MVRQRVRIRFAKREDLRFIGHRDLVRLMERLFRRAGIRLGMSQGFHPKPRMSFPSALAVGIEGHDEVMELEVAQPVEAEPLLAQLAEHAVPGLQFRHVELLAPGAPKARPTSAAYQVPVPAARRDQAADRVERLLAATEYPIRRPGKTRPVDLRPLLEKLALDGGVLFVRLAMGPGPGAGVRDVLAAMELDDLERDGVCLARTEVRIQTAGSRHAMRPGANRCGNTNAASPRVPITKANT
jgi:radical SAM-linked protein